LQGVFDHGSRKTDERLVADDAAGVLEGGQRLGVVYSHSGTAQDLERCQMDLVELSIR
jgi:hypothetical protein